MVYEIWHTPSGNALSEHPTRGNTKLVAAGADLLHLIEARV